MYSFVPDYIKGKSEESLLRALWEMGKDLGTATQTQTLASAATIQPCSASTSKRGAVHAGESTFGRVDRACCRCVLEYARRPPRRTQGWERSINLTQLIDPKIPDQDKSLRQVEILTRDLVAIAAYAKGIVKDEDLATLNRICLLMSTKPVGIYSVSSRRRRSARTRRTSTTSSITTLTTRSLASTSIGRRSHRIGWRQHLRGRSHHWSIHRCMNRARMRFAYFQQNWPLCCSPRESN